MNKDIAKKLETLRKDHGYSQEYIAEKLEVSRQAVSKWESGDSSPDTDHLIGLSKLYGITIDAILNTDAKKEKNLEAERENYFDKQYGGFTKSGKKSKAASFPFPVLVVALYLLIGFSLDRWHPTWLLFLTIPLYYIIVSVITGDRGAIHAVYPILVAAAFVFIGFFFGIWHPTWLLFFTIPLYYLVVGKKSIKGFLHAIFPIITALVFLILGFFFGLWHPGWVVFLAIPIWSWCVDTFIPGEKKESETEF